MALIEAVAAVLRLSGQKWCTNLVLETYKVSKCVSE